MSQADRLAVTDPPLLTDSHLASLARVTQHAGLRWKDLVLAGPAAAVAALDTDRGTGGAEIAARVYSREQSQLFKRNRGPWKYAHHLHTPPPPPPPHVHMGGGGAAYVFFHLIRGNLKMSCDPRTAAIWDLSEINRANNVNSDAIAHIDCVSALLAERGGLGVLMLESGDQFNSALSDLRQQD